MTAAFNLSQLANNLNTSGQLDASDGLFGVIPSANLSGTYAISISGNAATATNATNATNATSVNANGVTTASITNGSVTAPKLSGAQTGNPPIYGVRAWVRFNGFGSVGANQTIVGSGNVASAYKTNTGEYLITLTTAMPNTNYCAIVTSCGGDANVGMNPPNPMVFATRGNSGGAYSAPSTTQFYVTFYSTRNNTFYDQEDVNIYVLG